MPEVPGPPAPPPPPELYEPEPVPEAPSWPWPYLPESPAWLGCVALPALLAYMAPAPEPPEGAVV